MASHGDSLGDETVQRTMGDAADVRPDGARLTAVYPPEVQGAIELGEQEVVLGRKPKSDERSLRLEHKTASRRHFVVRYNGREHEGVDLGRRNGSRVDGRDVV